SSMAVGGGFIWMGANAAPNGIFQTDMNSKTVAHRPIPLGGGGCHGVEYVEGKLWIAALRLRGILRVDAKTWEPEFMIPYSVPRAHGTAWHDGAIWMVTGRSEEHTSELQSLAYLVCRLLLEKKKKKNNIKTAHHT